MLADQEGPVAGTVEPLEILFAADPALGNPNPILRQFLRQFFHPVEIAFRMSPDREH